MNWSLLLYASNMQSRSYTSTLFSHRHSLCTQSSIAAECSCSYDEIRPIQSRIPCSTIVQTFCLLPRCCIQVICTPGQAFAENKPAAGSCRYVGRGCLAHSSSSVVIKDDFFFFFSHRDSWTRRNASSAAWLSRGTSASSSSIDTYFVY
jgi:hypothetical protein